MYSMLCDRTTLLSSCVTIPLFNHSCVINVIWVEMVLTSFQWLLEDFCFVFKISIERLLISSYNGILIFGLFPLVATVGFIMNFMNFLYGRLIVSTFIQNLWSEKLDVSFYVFSTKLVNSWNLICVVPQSSFPFHQSSKFLVLTWFLHDLIAWPIFLVCNIVKFVYLSVLNHSTLHLLQDP